MIFRRRGGNGSADAAGRPTWLAPLAAAAAVLAVLLIGLAVYWSREPGIMWVNAKPDDERIVA